MNYSSDCEIARKKLQKYSYQLNNHIGKGYSSQVFKGRNDLTNQSVAIKVIDMKMIKGQVHKNLLASQIDILKILKSQQNIIDMYDIYTTKNNTYIITQLCNDGDLSKLISNKKSINESQAISLMNQIINGYNNISTANIIHRDLKPANIFLKGNQIKIADFGFALKSDNAKKYSSYNVGSPIYMPPEALNDNKYSFKSDIWALGVIYYQMLTGKTPWRAKTQKDLGRQLMSVPIQKLLPKNIGSASIQFLTKTLNININQRMGPEQLLRFTFSSHSTYNYDKQNSKKQLMNSNSIQDARSVLTKHNARTQTSLNRNNTISTPKNMTRFNFLKTPSSNNNFNTTQEQLLKTNNNFASKNSISITQTKTQNLITSTSNQNTQPSLNQIYNTTKNGATMMIDKKLISKQLLSQIHFCRFLYKLLIRISQKLTPDQNEKLNKMKQQMCGLVFSKLEQVQKLKVLSNVQMSQYKGTTDYQKILQIIHQYQSKYSKDLKQTTRHFVSYKSLRQTLTNQILSLHRQIQNKPSSQIKEQVIVLDYLITLRQLLYILQQQNLQVFHNKSKMQQIVQGAPAQTITNQHVMAITSKLKTLKML